MSLTAGVLATIIIQVGAGIWNYHSNKKHTEKIKELQRQSKKKNQEEEIKRAKERFELSCELQYKMEQEAHIERLDDIEQGFITSFEKYAHEQALSSYPLSISPYIIRNSVIPLSGLQQERAREEIFCILTNSNDMPFNRDIIPLLDQKMSEMISEYWNQRSLHTTCYYTETWKRNVLFCEDEITNLKSILRTPTITISPYVVKNDECNRLEIKVNLWDCTQELTYSYDTGITFRHPVTNLSREEKHKLASDAMAHIICSMGFHTDIYYWTTAHQPPLLPYLISEGNINCDNDTRETYTQAYTDTFKSLALGLNTREIAPDDVIKEHAEITLCNFPERSVEFLKSITHLTDEDYSSSILLSETLLSIFESRTDIKALSTSEIDTRYLTIDDINIISELIKIAKRCGRNDIITDFTDVIRKRILQK